VSEGSVTAGVRRVEVLTDAVAENYLNEKVALLSKAMEAFKNPKDLLKAITDLQDENKELQKEKEVFLLKEASMLQKTLRNEFVQHNGFNLLVKRIELSDSKAIKTLVTNLEREIGNAFIALGSVNGDKAQITIQVSDNLVKEKGFHAGNLVKQLNDGKGGGQPVFAAAGGIEVGGLDAMLEKVKGLV
jgi:alanyl-tRNA synthetase